MRLLELAQAYNMNRDDFNLKTKETLAKRVGMLWLIKELFETARANAPSILFFDGLDAFNPTLGCRLSLSSAEMGIEC
jgi:ATP-dependent 26S proteasome regulatory subunit